MINEKFLVIFFIVFQIGDILSHDNFIQIEDIEPPPSAANCEQIDGMDVLQDGRLAVCLPSGEIFIYYPVDKTWKLFAEGLHNPLGIIALSGNSMIVTQRPELTLVSDTDGDGVADHFKVLTDEFGLTGNYHEFNFTPVINKKKEIFFALGTASSRNGVRSVIRGTYDKRGRQGRMYSAASYRGWIMKYSSKGETIPYASGLRTPNGLGLDLDGNLFATDNQGDWIGSSHLVHVKKNRFYGHVSSLTWDPNFNGIPIKTHTRKLDKMRTRAAVVFPHGSMANSPTQILAIPKMTKLEDFEGQLLVGEMNKARIIRVMLEKIDGEFQGACVPFLDGAPLRLGANRMAWSSEGDLYIGYSKHSWAGNRGIQKVSFSSNKPFEIQHMKLTENGFELSFTNQIKQSDLDLSNFKMRRYYYEYHQSYGSQQMDSKDVLIKKLELSEDKTRVEIEIDRLDAWYIYELEIENLLSQDKKYLKNNFIVYSLNRLLKNTPTPPIQYRHGMTKSEQTKLKRSMPINISGD